jgi:hypothetical protein
LGPGFAFPEDGIGCIDIYQNIELAVYIFTRILYRLYRYLPEYRIGCIDIHQNIESAGDIYQNIELAV